MLSFFNLRDIVARDKEIFVLSLSSSAISLRVRSFWQATILLITCLSKRGAFVLAVEAVCLTVLFSLLAMILDTVLRFKSTDLDMLAQVQFFVVGEPQNHVSNLFSHCFPLLSHHF